MWRGVVQNWEVVSGCVAGLATIIGVLWRKVLRAKWRAFWQRYSALAIVSKLDEMSKRLDAVQVQVSPNGGKSLADAIERIECALKEHRAFARAIHDVQGVTFFSMDARGRMDFASAELVELIGNSALGNEWIAAIHPQDRHQIVTEVREAVNEQRRFRESLRFRHADGDVIGGVVEGRPLMVDGRLVGFVGIFRVAN